MTAHQNPQADMLDPQEWETCGLFNALGLDQDQQALLESAWQRCAPHASLQDFARALVNGGAKLALQLEGE